MTEKDRIRAQQKALRLALDPWEKKQRELRIGQRLKQLACFGGCDTLLIYVSKPPLEIGTGDLIRDALNRGKTVAVPRCIPGTREMRFRVIRGPEDLAPGAFGIPEPLTDRCREATVTPDSLCVVPGLCFDRAGFRLGYGKGYYDRFLADFPGRSAGLCFEENLVSLLPHGPFDRAADWIITENSAYEIPPGKSARQR